jgi:hypothetical protein
VWLTLWMGVHTQQKLLLGGCLGVALPRLKSQLYGTGQVTEFLYALSISSLTKW